MDERKTKTLKERLVWLEDNILAIIVFAITILLFVNVVLRYASRYFVTLPTISWAEEAIRYGIIWTTFLAAANAFRRESHFGVDLVVRVNSAPFVKFIRLLDDIGAFVFCGFVFYYGIKMVTFNMSGGQISPSLKLPLWMVYSIIPISGGMSLIFIVRNFIKKLKTPAEVLHAHNNTSQEGAES